MEMARVIDPLYELYVINGSGNGFRSIGTWYRLENPTFDKVEANEKQKEYASKIIENCGQVIVMKEAYADKYRFHCPKSFVHFFMSNLESAKALGEFGEKEERLEALCLDILGLKK